MCHKIIVSSAIHTEIDICCRSFYKDYYIADATLTNKTIHRKVPRICSGMIICTAIIEWNRFKQPKEPCKAFRINALVVIITKVHPKVHAHVLIII